MTAAVLPTAAVAFCCPCATSGRCPTRPAGNSRCCVAPPLWWCYAFCHPPPAAIVRRRPCDSGRCVSRGASLADATAAWPHLCNDAIRRSCGRPPWQLCCSPRRHPLHRLATGILSVPQLQPPSPSPPPPPLPRPPLLPASAPPITSTFRPVRVRTEPTPQLTQGWKTS